MAAHLCIALVISLAHGAPSCGAGTSSQCVSLIQVKQTKFSDSKTRIGELELFEVEDDDNNDNESNGNNNNNINNDNNGNNNNINNDDAGGDDEDLLGSGGKEGAFGGLRQAFKASVTAMLDPLKKQVSGLDAKLSAYEESANKRKGEVSALLGPLAQQLDNVQGRVHSRTLDTQEAAKEADDAAALVKSLEGSVSKMKDIATTSDLGNLVENVKKYGVARQKKVTKAWGMTAAAVEKNQQYVKRIYRALHPKK